MTFCITCKNNGIKKHAYFNTPGEKNGLYCSRCKLDGMIDVKHKRCFCGKVGHPLFNLPNEKTPLYCKDCKSDNMIDVSSKKCVCGKVGHPCFNLPSETIARYCKDCKTENMIDVIHKLCFCNSTRPIFDLPSKTIARYCKDCKTENMIDIMNKRCVCGKSTSPNFNFINEKIGLYCSECRLDNMIDVVHKKCKCGNPVSFNIPGKEALFCGSCKLKSMIDVKHPKCKSCGLFYVIKITDICYYCNPVKNKKYKQKENIIKELLQDNNIVFIQDKPLQTINNECQKYRPDFLIDCHTFFLILEVDEYAHKDYDKECELIRMNNIVYNLGLPCVFLRYNPDWSKTGTNNKMKKLIKHTLLMSYIRHYQTLKTIPGLIVEYLFYTPSI